MSFAEKVKEELLGIELKTDSEKTGFLIGAIKSVGSLEIKKTGYMLIFASNNYGYIMAIASCIKSLYRVELSVGRTGTMEDKKGFMFSLAVPTNKTTEILEDTSIAKIKDYQIVGFNNEFDSRVYKDLDTLKAVVRALYIGSGNAYVPTKIDLTEEESNTKSDGYRLEFVFEDGALADEVCELLQTLSTSIKSIERQSNYVVYTKDSSLICDIFAWLGANNGVLELNDIIVERSVSNEVNRMNNCVLANIDKAVNAGLKQIKAIEYIQQTIGLSKLDDNLREIALLRISKPSATLLELEEALEHKITKSGINHRLRKIVEIADKLKEKTNE